MASLAKAAFAQKRLQVPIGWRQPRDAVPARQLVDSMAPADRNVPPPPLGPDLLFERALPCRLFTCAQETLSRSYAEFFDGICAATCAAWAAWQQGAQVTATFYAAGLANGGTVAAPPWSPLIVAQGPKVPWTALIASAVDAVWLQHQATLVFAAAPLFMGNLAVPIPPTGDALPGLPGPAGPVPLRVACPGQLPIQKGMLTALLQDSGAFAAEVFDAYAEAFAQCFTRWSATTVINSSAFLLTCVNPAPVPIPRMVGIAPMTTGPVFV